MKHHEVNKFINNKMNRYRIIFFDLDGTLLDSNKSISNACVDILKMIKVTKGVHFGIASGRAISSINPIIRNYKMENLFDVVIANNGADIVDLRSSKIESHGYLTTSQIRTILNHYKDNKKINVYFHNEGIVYAKKVNQRIENIRRMNEAKEIRNPYLDIIYKPCARVMCQFDDPTVIKDIDPNAFADLKAYHSETDIIEYLNESVSKADSILKYLKKMNSNSCDALAFGDQSNDIPMLKACGISVVMKNGSDLAKRNANIVTDYTNDEDGIMKFFKEYM